MSAIELPTPSATTRLGEGLGRAVLAECAGREPGQALLVALCGPLGAGKTTFARGVLRGLGHTGPVKSPTYTLVEDYEPGDTRVHHLDLYRLADPQELEMLGFRDCLGDAHLCLVEWPERAGDAFPEPDLRVLLAHADPGRRARIETGSVRGEAVAAVWQGGRIS